MRQIDGHTRLLGLIGNPIGHTLSPVIHNTLSELLDYNQIYTPFQVTSEGLEQAVKGAYELNVLGMNVTVPHKNQVMQYVTETDPVAQTIGAVNTLVRQEQGYKGYNTDMPGLLRAIRSEGIDLKGQNVMILGAGGASKAVAYMCMQEEAQSVYMLNRTVDKAEAIAAGMNQAFQSQRMKAGDLQTWQKLDGSWIVFQCTSLGLYPNTEQVVIEAPEFYQKVLVGVDLIYNPAQTRFMKLVEAAGGRSYNGLKMLLYQGIIAYELWNQISVTEEQAEAVYDRLYEAIHPSGDNVILIGFMGSGKTTIGHTLQEKYGYEFLDTDAYIEEKEGRKISQIFQEDGEAYFRRLETQVLRELAGKVSHKLIATGGGTPLQRENARLLRELGRVYYLRTGEEEIWKRVKDSQDRPLLACEDPRGRIRELFHQRQALYQHAAHVEIDTDGKTPEEIAHMIDQEHKDRS